MGDNTLTSATDGTIIPASDHNSIVTALKDNFVPRGTSTLAPTDLAGDLGTTSYRWDSAYLKEVILGAISSQISIEEDGSNRMAIKVGGSTAMTIDSGGLIPDSIVTDMITDANITKPKLAALGQQLSSSSGDYNTSSTSYTAVTNLSVTITTTGRPVYLGIINDGSTVSGDEAAFGIASPSGTTATGFFQFMRDSTSLGEGWLQDSAEGVSAISIIPFGPNHIDVITAGTYTYTVQVKVASGDLLYCAFMKLIAFEL